MSGRPPCAALGAFMDGETCDGDCGECMGETTETPFKLSTQRDAMRLRVQPASVDVLERAIATGTIRALSVKQPWASLLAVCGMKTCENRSWIPREATTLTDAGGWFLVHASKFVDTPRNRADLDDVARQHVGPLPRADVDTILRAIAGVGPMDDFTYQRVTECDGDLRMADTTQLHYLLAAKLAVDGKGGGQRTGAILGAEHVVGFSGGKLGEWDPADPWKREDSVGWHVDAAIDFGMGVAATGRLGLWPIGDVKANEVLATRPGWRWSRRNGALVLPAVAAGGGE